MSVDQQQRESYRMALQAWINASKNANGVRNRLHSASTNLDNMYLVTQDELSTLQKEAEHFNRLASVASQL